MRTTRLGRGSSAGGSWLKAKAKAKVLTWIQDTFKPEVTVKVHIRVQVKATVVEKRKVSG